MKFEFRSPNTEESEDGKTTWLMTRWRSSYTTSEKTFVIEGKGVHHQDLSSNMAIRII